jgi:hypothetical protein
MMIGMKGSTSRASAQRIEPSRLLAIAMDRIPRY